MKSMRKRGISRSIAFGMALAFCAWLTMSTLIACPFLQAELSAAKHPCCPRTNAPVCPLSKSIQNCPFSVSESKIGVTENIRHFDVALLAAPILLSAPSLVEMDQFQPDRPQDASDLLLRIHVLRI
jgi:hypothetical protein